MKGGDKTYKINNKFKIINFKVKTESKSFKDQIKKKFLISGNKDTIYIPLKEQSMVNIEEIFKTIELITYNIGAEKKDYFDTSYFVSVCEQKEDCSSNTDNFKLLPFDLLTEVQ